MLALKIKYVYKNQREETMETGNFNRNRLESIIEAIIDEEGILQIHKGFKYINQAVYLVLQDEERLDALTKEVYGEIARSHQTSIPSVERTIRFAIQKGAHQTNKTFIATMAKRVRHLEDMKSVE